MSNNHITNVRSLLIKVGFPNDCQIVPLPFSGSNRLYYRVIFNEHINPHSIIASYNGDVSENIAHNSYTFHFRSLGFAVPEIYTHDSSYKYFLIQDLGKTTLLDLLSSEKILAEKYYKKVISDLVKFQVIGIKNLDLDVAYPVKEFNQRSIMWDLNYFKYYFVKPHNIEFNENLLEDDFIKFANILLSAENKYFNYRDFQARNILIYGDQPWYIDFQGGRQGPLQYDLVSLLYQVKANLSADIRSKLYSHYIDELNKIIPGKQVIFEKYYYNFVYFRLMQVMGAYGFRGIVQRKAHFLQSIPMAIWALKKLLQENPIFDDLKELSKVFNQIVSLEYDIRDNSTTGFTINVNSFSFKKKGIPIDVTGNGGGHVFDCRSLPNPGRLAELRDFTGLDDQIIQYLERHEEINEFIINTKKIINQSTENYIKRGFNNLQINFGCTGGRHRSVYSASKIGEYLMAKYPKIVVIIKHHELD